MERTKTNFISNGEKIVHANEFHFHQFLSNYSDMLKETEIALRKIYGVKQVALQTSELSLSKDKSLVELIDQQGFDTYIHTDLNTFGKKTNFESDLSFMNIHSVYKLVEAKDYFILSYLKFHIDSVKKGFDELNLKCDGGTFFASEVYDFYCTVFPEELSNDVELNSPITSMDFELETKKPGNVDEPYFTKTDLKLYNYTFSELRALKQPNFSEHGNVLDSFKKLFQANNIENYVISKLSMGNSLSPLENNVLEFNSGKEGAKLNFAIHKGSDLYKLVLQYASIPVELKKME